MIDHATMETMKAAKPNGSFNGDGCGQPLNADSFGPNYRLSMHNAITEIIRDRPEPKKRRWLRK